MFPSAPHWVFPHWASVEVITRFYFLIHVLSYFKLPLTVWKLGVEDQGAAFWLSSHGRVGSRGMTLVTYLPEAPAPNTITLQSWVSIYELGRGHTHTLRSGDKPCLLLLVFCCFFYICIYKGYWSVVFFSCAIFVWLWYRGSANLMNELGSVPSYLSEESEKDWC